MKDTGEPANCVEETIVPHELEVHLTKEVPSVTATPLEQSTPPRTSPTLDKDSHSPVHLEDTGSPKMTVYTNLGVIAQALQGEMHQQHAIPEDLLEEVLPCPTSPLIAECFNALAALQNYGSEDSPYQSPSTKETLPLHSAAECANAPLPELVRLFKSDLEDDIVEVEDVDDYPITLNSTPLYSD